MDFISYKKSIYKFGVYFWAHTEWDIRQ